MSFTLLGRKTLIYTIISSVQKTLTRLGSFTFAFALCFEKISASRFMGMQTVVSSRRRRWDLCLTIFHLSCVYKQPVTSILSSSCFERWRGFFRIANGKFL